jgi:hypothetical protein
MKSVERLRVYPEPFGFQQHSYQQKFVSWMLEV